MYVRRRRHVKTLLVLLVALALLLPAASVAHAQARSRHFPQTGHTVRGAFLDYFQTHGGVAIFGYPLTEETVENGRTVQYFQRARFEWHPNNPPQYQVLLGLLGEQIHGPAEPAVPKINKRGVSVRYFPETGHNVTNTFLAFWVRNGGIDNFGLPLTEAFTRGGVTYQWFQRARFELRDGKVSLGNIGQEWLQGNIRVPAAPPPGPERSRSFGETGQSVSGMFLDFFEKNGGVRIFGYPISGVFTENGRRVQYFQRARFEDHGNKVLLGLLGQELYGPPAAPVSDFTTPWNPDYRYFRETGHVVSFSFLRFWQQNGGLDIFGYPLTEATREEGGVVQWFQRAKMTYRNGQVHLENLGERRFNPDNEGRFGAGGAFYFVWNGNPRVRDGLGQGLEDMKEIAMAEQSFEGGRMIWRSDTNQIFVLYKNGTWEVHPNTWRPGEPAKLGYRTPPGRLEPVLGLGKLWRSLGNSTGPLGWATEPQENYDGQAQQFQRGHMLLSEPSDAIFVLYSTGNWEHFEDVYELQR